MCPYASLPLLSHVVHDMSAKGAAAVGPVASTFPSSLLDGEVRYGSGRKSGVGHVENACPSSLVVDMGGAGSCPFLHQGIGTCMGGHAVTLILPSSPLPAEEGHPLVVLDVPLLYETGLEAAVDAVVVVSAPMRMYSGSA